MFDKHNRINAHSKHTISFRNNVTTKYITTRIMFDAVKFLKLVEIDFSFFFDSHSVMSRFEND